MRCSSFALILLFASPALRPARLSHDRDTRRQFRSQGSGRAAGAAPEWRREDHRIRRARSRRRRRRSTIRESRTCTRTSGSRRRGRSTRRLRIDPSLALAWVGLSRAYTGLDDMKAARAGTGPREGARGQGHRSRAAVDTRPGAAARRARPTSRIATKRLAYVAALDEALEYDADDAELWTLRGNVEEVHLGAAGRGQRGTFSSIVFYEEALRRVPGHFPGASLLDPFVRKHRPVRRSAETWRGVRGEPRQTFRTRCTCTATI